MLISAALAGACTVGDGNADGAADLQRRIDPIFSDIGAHRPGYAIGIIEQGELVFARGYGLANVVKGEAISADTAFNLASLSKQFTAAAVAREIVEGRMRLEDPIRSKWPELPAFMEPVTIGHLVYMTSGVPEYFTLPSPRGGWSSENRFTVKDALGAVFRSNGLVFEPGTRWAYSNSNYLLLAELVARRNNTNFADHMERSFFKPLGMTRTWVDARLEQRPAIARAYIATSDTARWQEAPRLSPHYGGSGIYSTLSDLARWDAALFRDRVFGQAFTETMLSTRHYAHPKANDAFGLVHGIYNGRATIWYEGGDFGVSTFSVRVPGSRVTVICLANFAEAGCRERAYRVLDAFLEARAHPGPVRQQLRVARWHIMSGRSSNPPPRPAEMASSG